MPLVGYAFGLTPHEWQKAWVRLADFNDTLLNERERFYARWTISLLHRRCVYQPEI